MANNLEDIVVEGEPDLKKAKGKLAQLIIERSKQSPHPITNGLGISFTRNVTSQDVDNIISSLPAKYQVALKNADIERNLKNADALNAFYLVWANSVALGLPSVISEDFKKALNKGIKNNPGVKTPGEIAGVLTPFGGPAKVIGLGGKWGARLGEILSKMPGANKLPQPIKDIAIAGIEGAGALSFEEISKIDKIQDAYQKNESGSEAIADLINRGMEAADAGFKFGAGTTALMKAGSGVITAGGEKLGEISRNARKKKVEKQIQKVQDELESQGIRVRSSPDADDIATVIDLSPVEAEDFREMTGGVNIEDVAARNGIHGHLVDLYNATNIKFANSKASQKLAQRNALIKTHEKMGVKLTPQQINNFFKEAMDDVAALERRGEPSKNLLKRIDARRDHMLERASRSEGLTIRDLQEMVDDFERVESMTAGALKKLGQARNSDLDKRVNMSIRRFLREEMPELGRMNQDLAGFMRIKRSTGIADQAQKQGKAKGLPTTAKDLTLKKTIGAATEWVGKKTRLNKLQVFERIKGTRISEGAINRHAKYLERQEGVKEKLVQRKALLEKKGVQDKPGLFENGSKLLIEAADDMALPNSPLRNKLNSIADKTFDNGLKKTVEDMSLVGSEHIRKGVEAATPEDDLSDLEAEFGAEDDLSDLEAEFGGGEREPQSIEEPIDPNEEQPTEESTGAYDEADLERLLEKNLGTEAVKKAADLRESDIKKDEMARDADIEKDLMKEALQR